jgi:gp187
MALKITTGIENFKPWSGAVSTWDEIEEQGKISDLEFLLEELYPDGIDETKLNDLLWFESDWLFANLDMNNMVCCSYCDETNDMEDTEEDELGNMICPNCGHAY